MVQKLIIDADPGIGDATTILLAMLDPDIEVVGLTATGGTVTGHQAARNLQFLIELADPPKRPRLGYSEDPESYFELGFGSETASLRELNGPFGLGELTVDLPELVYQRESQKVLTELVRDDPHEISILTLGPLTNIAAAYERTPDLPGMLNGLVCLGGSLNAGGNVTAAAEFNVFSNPRAARSVLRARTSKMLIPLDVSDQLSVPPTSTQRVSTHPVVQAINQMLQFAFRSQRQFYGCEGVRLGELVALAAVARPKLFESQSMVLDIETAGEISRGATVFDRRGTKQWQTNIDVCVDADFAGVLDYFHELLERASAIA